jgi:ADP-ribose pyrophosphatase YjhB (NUDIX family)
MIKIRILNENIITEQKKMSLQEVIDFYNNNINSLIAMSNGEKEKNQEIWNFFQQVALDCYKILEDSVTDVKVRGKEPGFENHTRRIKAFLDKFDDYLKGKQFKKLKVGDSELEIPVKVLDWGVKSFFVPKGRFEDVSEETLEDLFFIMENYIKWYNTLKAKLGSWSQRNFPTVRGMLGLKENIITEQEKITLSQIVGENSVISFDFDNTLVKSYPDFDEDGNLIYVNGGSNATMINLMKHLIDDPSKKVYVVTSRVQGDDEKNPEQAVLTQLDKLNLTPDGLIYTNEQPKVTKLKELGVEIHFDDDKIEHGDIQGSGIQSFYPDDFLEDTNQVSKVVAVTLDNKVLILKRADTGEMDLPGGHGKSGESNEYAATREFLEETGLNVYGIKPITTKNITFNGRNEDIHYFYAKLNNTAELLMDDVDLDINENTEFYFVDPQNIDEYMGNATNNLKNMSNDIKSMTISEHTEPFQRKIAAKHRKYMKQMFKSGGFKKKMGPYNQNPPMERSKSAPPIGESVDLEKKRRIKVKIIQNIDEKHKKRRKKRKKTAKYGGYYPYFDIYDGSGGDSGGDGGGGE